MSQPPTLPLDARLRTVLAATVVDSLDTSHEFVGQRGLDLLGLILDRTNIDDFAVRQWQADRLTLTGSFDHCYYHEVAVHFVDVIAAQLPAHLHAQRFRLSTKQEREAFSGWVGLDDPEVTLFAIEGDAGGRDRVFFVAASAVEVDPGLVFYYDREAQQPLKPGERVDPGATAQK